MEVGQGLNWGCTCRDNHEFNLISRTCVTIDCTVTANNVVDFNGAPVHHPTSKQDGGLVSRLKDISFSDFFSGVGLTSPGTAATSGLLYSPR
jgi:hypothetical protein